MDNYIITLLIQKKEDNCKNINEVKLEVMDALHEEGTYEPLDVYATTQIEKAYAAGRSNYGTIGRKKYEKSMEKGIGLRPVWCSDIFCNATSASYG